METPKGNFSEIITPEGEPLESNAEIQGTNREIESSLLWVGFKAQGSFFHSYIHSSNKHHLSARSPSLF